MFDHFLEVSWNLFIDTWIFVQWLLGGSSYGMAECICVKKKLTLWYIYLDLPSPSSVIFMLVLVIFSDYCISLILIRIIVYWYMVSWGSLHYHYFSACDSFDWIYLDIYAFFEVGTSILDYYRWYFGGTILVQEGKWDTWSFVSRWIILWIIWCVGTSVIFEIFMWYFGRSLVADSWR